MDYTWWKRCDLERMMKSTDGYYTWTDIKETVKDTPDEVQIGGQHYKQMSIQPWTYIAANNLDFFQGNIVKYITRWKDKGGVEDLLKAKHVLEKYIEVNQCESKKTEA